MALYRSLNQQTTKLILKTKLNFRAINNNQELNKDYSNSLVKNKFLRSNYRFINLLSIKFNSAQSFDESKSLTNQENQADQSHKANKSSRNKMSASESEEELTIEQTEELFLKTPAHLIIRLDSNQKEDAIYLRLLYKYKIFDKDKYKIKNKLFSFKRKPDENLKEFIDKMKLSVAKFVLIGKSRKSSDRKKKYTEIIDDKDVSNQNLLDVRFLYKDKDLLKNDLNMQLNELFKLNEQDLKLIINSFEYKVYLNPQFISQCKLPKVILSNFEVFPQIKVDFKKSDIEPLYGWYRKLEKHIQKSSKYLKLKKEGKIKDGFLKLSDQMTYTPDNDDVGNELIFKITTRLAEDENLETFEVNSRKVIKSTDYYPFEKRHEFTRNKTEADEFRIVSYNILADMYSDSKTAREELFAYCPPKYLTMDYRRHLLLKELLGYNADLICLQEVDSNIFEKHLEPAFKLRSNLTGLISLKNEMQEGCALFYNQDKFKLVENANIKISDLIKKDCFEKLNEQIQKSPQLNERFSIRPNILQVAALELLKSDYHIVLLFNTHLYFHPDSDHIRLLQSCMIIKEIEDLVQKYSKSYKSVVPIVVGDFNSCPEFGVYKLFTQSKIDKHLEDWRSCESEFIENFDFESNLKFVSAYGCPKYTNYTELFAGCLDYIFFDPTKLNCKEIVPLISHQDVILNRAIPSLNIPSDHLALVATLKFL